MVKPPPPEGTAATTPSAAEQTDLGLPRGTVLFHVVRGQGQDRLVPVAEVSGDSLRALQRPAGVSPQAYEQRFRDAVMPANGQFVLFRRGARVGTFTLGAPGPLTSCGVPTGVGQAATVAAAAADQEFLAFRKGLEPDVVGEFSPPQVDGPIRRYAPLVAERLVLTGGLPRPGSWPRSVRDLQALDLVRGGNAEMATTFLSGDNLAPGAGDKEGWSVFYVAAYEQRTGYNPIYSEVADYRRVPKRAPKAVDYLNWNGKGGNELLIQVFGPTDAWYEAISADRGGRWLKVWEGKACR
ncbi:MAG TPA: hypothetical protein VFJ82_10180 [Longimicrobium sp.]|nr:hypothetical protein [Longimicrobium sp.]